MKSLERSLVYIKKYKYVIVSLILMNRLVDLLVIVASILALAAATSSAFYLLVLGTSQPLYVVLSMLLLGMFLLLLYFSFIRESESQPPQKEQPRPVVAPVEPLPQPTVAATPVTMVSIARLETKEGKIIPVTNVRQVFGRKDFAGLLDPSLLAVISREHFTVFYDFRSGKFFIEDYSSTNGTLLNGDQIRGRGPVELKNGDIVSPAGVIDLVFKV
jgi:hypothetical protein